MESNRVYAGGKHLLILTEDGCLYGFGDNSQGAICPDGGDFFEAPYLISQNVCSAAASAHCSLYVTTDGTVHLLGKCPFTGFDNASQVWAGLLSDSFWIRDRDGTLYCFGENHSPRSLLVPWSKEYVQDLPQERCTVSTDWGRSDLQQQTNSIEYKILHSEEFLDMQARLGARNTGLELVCTGSRRLGDKKLIQPSYKEEYTFLPRIYYVNNYYRTPVLCPDQSFADTPHTEGCAPLGASLREKLPRDTDVRKAVHIRGYQQFLLLLKDGSVCLADHRGNRIWENVFPEPVSDISWGDRYMAVAFRSGRIAWSNAHTAYLRELKDISLPVPVFPKVSRDASCPETLPCGVFGGGKHFLLLDQGRLYSLGMDESGQFYDISFGEKKLCLLAENVISAAAGANYSIYVTSDGVVRLHGSGELGRLFPGFTGAKAVYAAQDRDLFYIHDRSDQVFVFGDNRDFKICPEEKTVLTEFTDDMISDALRKFGSWDPHVYVRSDSREEKSFWFEVLQQTDICRDAVEKYGQPNVLLGRIALYHPSACGMGCRNFRREGFGPLLYRTNTLITAPVPVTGVQAGDIANPLPVFRGCLPYALGPDGYEAEQMCATMSDATKILFNSRYKGLVLRSNRTLAVYNSWNGIYYAPYPSLPPVRDISINAENRCLISFETGQFYLGPVEALEVFSPWKSKHLEYRIWESGKLILASGEYQD